MSWGVEDLKWLHSYLILRKYLSYLINSNRLNQQMSVIQDQNVGKIANNLEIHINQYLVQIVQQ